MSTSRGRNALANTRSPFLQHGAQQPVDWMPWGAEAFERSRAENRPILLDIGAVWCHWCHVMDHESYEDPETARIINELFIPVKVDRDERPDVDARYQRAVQALSGQGGWPLTAFLTTDGEVYYGGTYFPPQESYGRPSFRRVLREVARIWSEDPSRAREAAESVRSRVTAYTKSETQPGEVTTALIDEAAEEFAHNFDFRHGGFGRAPKFPNAGALALLLDYSIDSGHEWARRMVAETLVAMARGGIYDQLGGGFHRYSTDLRWIIPHFEKMAYDNGVLLEGYAQAYAAVGGAHLRDAAAGIVAHYVDVAPVLVQAGGFPASQDADVGNDDGDYWTWTLPEVHDALSGDEQLDNIARLHFGLDDEGSAMHLDPARHVLFQALAPAEVGAKLGMQESDVRTKLADVRTRLKRVRDARPRPYVDETVYSSWTALVASGHIAVARYLEPELELREAGPAGLRALERIWGDAFVAGKGVQHRVGDAESGYFLEDQAYVAQTLLDAFEYTQAESYLRRAEELVRVTLAHFQDDDGAFGDVPTSARTTASPLGEEHRPIADAPSPAGNAVMALVLQRLSALTHAPEYAREAARVLRAFAGTAARMPTATATYLRAVAWATLPVTTVVIVTNEDDPVGDALLRTALSTYHPRTVVRRITPAAAQSTPLPPELQAMVTAESPRAYVCIGQTCAAPTSDPEVLAQHLRAAQV
jgi:uncharacterized protein YyaL (SSP411 family)